MKLGHHVFGFSVLKTTIMACFAVLAIVTTIMIVAPIPAAAQTTTTTTTQTTTPGSGSGAPTTPTGTSVEAVKPVDEVLSGTAEIEGEAAPLIKAARANHKKACEEWKKEVQELNKQNQVLSLNCGSTDCAQQSSALTVCRSTGSYKIRLKRQ